MGLLGYHFDRRGVICVYLIILSAFICGLRSSAVEIMKFFTIPGLKHLLTGLVFLGTISWLPADDVGLRTEIGPETMRILLIWPKPVHFESSTHQRELVLRFDRPVQAPGMDRLPAKAPEWIEGVVSGYDSILVLAARDVRYLVSREGNTVIVQLTPETPHPESITEEEAHSQLRLDLLQARLYVERGRLDRAHELLTRLAAERPQNLDILANLARLEHTIGRWRRADRLYEEALQQSPDNEDVLASQIYLRGEQAPRIRVDEEHKTVVGRWSEQLTRVSGHSILSPGLRIGGTYDLNQVEANGVQRSDGRTEPFDGSRQRGEFYVEYDFEGGSRLRGSAFGGRSTWGAGMQFSNPDAWGRTSVQVDFQRPFWEFIEGVVDEGVRDRIEVERRLRAGTRWNGWGNVSLNRYGLGGDDDVAKSVGVAGGMALTLLKSEPTINLEYGFDGEYRKSIESRTGFDGAPFHPLPLISREVHSLGTQILAPIVSHFTANGYGGYLWDRLGGQGPFFGLRLTFDTPADFGAQVWFDRRLNSINTGERVNRFGGRLLWRF